MVFFGVKICFFRFAAQRNYFSRQLVATFFLQKQFFKCFHNIFSSHVKVRNLSPPKNIAHTPPLKVKWLFLQWTVDPFHIHVLFYNNQMSFDVLLEYKRGMLLEIMRDVRRLNTRLNVPRGSQMAWSLYGTSVSINIFTCVS